MHIYELIKTLDIRSLIVSNLAFPSNTILFWFFLFFLIIDLYFSVSAVIAQVFIPNAELAIPEGAPTSEVNAQIETQQLTIETENKKMFKVI